MRSILTPLLTLLLIGACLASDVHPEKIDQLFEPYAKPHSPGCSVGIIRDGKFVFRKSYGEASLELSVPLAETSVFYLASMSKQFTAASIVLAQEQGLLSLDDDVRKYIPELPDYGHRITLRQMLHQTSGYRDFLSLVYLSGHEIADLASPGDILKLIARQKALNNVPGEEFIYSNSNYFLLGVVIHRATGKTLAQFAEETIFRPLGMERTRFYDDNTLVVPGRVPAYDSGEKEGFLVDWSTSYDIVGGGGAMSTINDLLLWDNNFYANKLGKGTLVRELETAGRLNDGHAINYGLGLWLGKYRGLPVVEHGGGTFGYRTELTRFSEQRFSVVCLCNISTADPEGLAQKIADLYLEHEFPGEPGANAAGASPNLPDPTPFAGSYFDPRTHMVYTFTVVDGKLMAWGAVLHRISANQFNDLSTNVITFQPTNKTMRVTLDVGGEIYFSGDQIPDLRLTEAAMKAYGGNYRSDELDYGRSAAHSAYPIIEQRGEILSHPIHSTPSDFFHLKYVLLAHVRKVYLPLSARLKPCPDSCSSERKHCCNSRETADPSAPLRSDSG